MAQKKDSDTSAIPNIYEMKNRKSKQKKRLIPDSDNQYKTNDTKRKSHSLSRKKKRKILGIFLFSFFVVAILIALVIGLSQAFCRVSDITVTYTNKSSNSARYYTNEEIINSSEIKKENNLLLLSASKVSKNIEKICPYISVASVKKDYPTGVIIELTECKKVYAYKAKAGYFLADENGKYLELADNKKAKPYFKITVNGLSVSSIGEKIKISEKIINDKGEEEELDHTDYLLEYLALIRKSGMNIKSVDFSDLEDVYMNYDGRIEIHIGKMKDEANGVTEWKKIQLAKKSLEAEDKINPEQRGTLNMTISKKAYFKAESVLPDE